MSDTDTCPTTNETILDLIIRDIAAQRNLDDLKMQLDELHKKRGEIIESRQRDAAKAVKMVWPNLSEQANNPSRDFLLPSGKIATVFKNGEIAIRTITKL